MKLVSLMYHDIVTTKASRRYSFSVSEFRDHLAVIKKTVGGAPAVPGSARDMSGFALTFDDGHSGWLHAAEALQELQWKASFFVVTSWIGKAGLLDRSDIKRLAGMGHVIGSHTVDHPYQLSHRDEPFIRDQWSRSRAVLEDILGSPVTSAAVPGGSYGAKVGRAAAESGVKHLFTSDPVTTSVNVGGCRIMGRFALTSGMSSHRVARIAAGTLSEHALHYFVWNIKKVVKSVMPGPYRALREFFYPN
jgi:peptidoglycan/xylan/chitin deacetylase (PgdA/CDA1 family)